MNSMKKYVAEFIGTLVLVTLAACIHKYLESGLPTPADESSAQKKTGSSQPRPKSKKK